MAVVHMGFTPDEKHQDETPQSNALRAKQWRQANPERWKAIVTRHRKKHRKAILEKERERSKKYRSRNREEINEKARKAYALKKLEKEAFISVFNFLASFGDPDTVLFFNEKSCKHCGKRFAPKTVAKYCSKTCTQIARKEYKAAWARGDLHKGK